MSDYFNLSRIPCVAQLPVTSISLDVSVRGKKILRAFAY